MTSRSESRGAASLGYQSILNADRTPPPPVLRIEARPELASTAIDIDRYVSAEFAALERERLWNDVWQMACRVEHLPDVGDHVLYEVGDVSLIVVRSATDTIKAFHNSCLHRGTALIERSGSTAVFRCPFHGFAWSLDGSFRGMPAPWDFPHIEPAEFCLPEAVVAIWEGFVFVQPAGSNAGGPSFERFSDPLTEHFSQHPLSGRYVAHHACQVVAANWKTTMEAFLEAYHVSTTHPHTIRFANDFECQYDTFGPNVSRLMQAIGVPASALAGLVEPAEIARTVQKMLPAEHSAAVPDDVNVRAFLGERFRESFSARWDIDLSAASEAELLDSLQYYLFPNFSPWMGYSIPIAYRFRPWGHDPNESLMEIMLLHPLPADGDYEVAGEHWLEPGESWTHAPGFELLGMVIDQDMENLPKVQKGLRHAKHRHVVLADYQESRIRHFHARLDAQLGLNGAGRS